MLRKGDGKGLIRQFPVSGGAGSRERVRLAKRRGSSVK